MSFRLIVFDWDGTLMDSESRIVGCMREAMAAEGLVPATQGSVREVIGLGLAEAVERLLPRADAGLRERVALAYRQRFLAAESDPSPLFPGVRELLGWLEAQDYLLAVATGKGRRGLDQALGATGLGRLFHATRCADETRSKPHPAMLIELMEVLGARPSETLMVGDTEYDLLMAQNAGTQALAVCYGVHDPDRLRGLRPLGCVDDLREIRRWLRPEAAPTPA